MGAIVTEEDQTLGAESRGKTVFLIADIIHRDRERNWQAVTTENWLAGQADLGKFLRAGQTQICSFLGCKCIHSGRVSAKKQCIQCCLLASIPQVKHTSALVHSQRRQPGDIWIGRAQAEV